MADGGGIRTTAPQHRTHVATIGTQKTKAFKVFWWVFGFFLQLRVNTIRITSAYKK